MEACLALLQPFLGHPEIPGIHVSRDTWDYLGMSLVRVTDYTAWVNTCIQGYLGLSWDVRSEGD